MKTLILHIGTPKTGTTSIQNFCGLNRERLDELGIHYPIMPYRYPRVNVNRNGHFLVGAVKIDSEGHRDKEKEKEIFSQELKNLAKLFKEHNTIVLSEESIWMIAATRKKGLWKTLKKHSEKHDYQIKVIVYLRRQDQFLLSRYNQKLKTDVVASVRRFDRYMKTMNGRYKPTLFYRERLDDIAKFIPKENIIVRRFDRKYFYNGSLTDDFLHILGIEIDETFAPLEEKANVGISVQSGEIKRVLNRLKPISFTDNNKLIEILNECEELLPESNTELMSTEEVKTFMGQFIEGNESIVADYIGDDAPLFDYTYKEATAWNYNDPNYHEEVILFFAKVIDSVYKENLQLKAENKTVNNNIEKINKQITQINDRLTKEKSYSRETRYLLKHPISSLFRKIIGCFKKK